MKQNIKKIWIEALRSGDYKQGTGALRITSENEKGETIINHCCLGVLCNLHKKIMKKKGWDGYNYLGEDCFIPESVKKWAGLESGNGAFEYKNGESTSLVSLNDEGKSFKQIANIIEKYF